MIVRFITREPTRQRGAVLIISLIILMVITLIGISAMQTTTLDTKIAGNYRSYKISFEGAEAALTEAQSRLGIPLDLLVTGKFDRPKIEHNNEPNPKIWDPNPPIPENCKLDQNAAKNDPWWFQWDWDCWRKNAIEYSNTIYGLETTSEETASRPLYLIEYQGPGSETGQNVSQDRSDYSHVDYYRITARGSTGQNSQSDVILQSTFAWRYGKD